MNQKIELIDKALSKLSGQLESCSLCPRNCQVNRAMGEIGYCQTGKDILIYSYFLHHGEEPPISANNGSGTIFFSGCNLRCIFCQNYQFSHLLAEKIPFSETQTAEIILKLQDEGAVNINLVTPTHFLVQILKSLKIALEKGLTLPIVYNSSGYEKPAILGLLDGIIDIYLYDIKYIYPQTAQNYSHAPDYPENALKSALVAYLQTKEAIFENDIMKKGMIIRHLVLPGHSQESLDIINWILDNNLNQAYLSLMSQYQPYFKAKDFPEINRTLMAKEYAKVKKVVEQNHLQGWIQETPDEKLAGVYFKQKNSH